MPKFTSKLFGAMLILAVLAVVAILGRVFWTTSKTIFDLLGENRQLRKAIGNLTAETQIGYAKVIDQTQRDGKLHTRLLFVETARDNPQEIVLSKEYVIEGDVVFFDALIVKFSNDYVSDGRGRALYLWSRIYGEQMAPSHGFAIEEPGKEPQRYKEISAVLSVKDRDLFWSEIWKLSDDPERLRAAGIDAVYGNAVYKKVRPGLLYVFRITNTGQVYPETLPAL